jgi:hypothetical protein
VSHAIKRFAGKRFIDSADFIDNSAGANNRNPAIDIAFTRTHPNLKRLGRYRFMWKDANPDFAVASNTVASNTTSLDCASAQPSPLSGLETILTERNSVSAGSDFTADAFLGGNDTVAVHVATRWAFTVWLLALVCTF